jgi:phage gpG-like protein
MPVVVGVYADETRLLLKQILARGENFLPVMMAFGGWKRGEIEKDFAAGGRPPWAPLKLGTMSGWAVSRKSYVTKAGFLSKTGREALAGRKILVRSGLLLRQIYPIPGTMSLEVVARAPYAAVHQFGAKIPPIYPKTKKALFWPGLAHPVKHTRGAVIPARPFLVWRTADLEALKTMLAAYVASGKLG